MVGKMPARGRVLRQGESAAVPGHGQTVDHAFHQPSIRVLLADHRQLIRANIRALLHEAPDLEVVGEVEQAQEVLRASRRTKPNVILLAAGLLEETEGVLFRRLFAVLPPIRLIALLWDYEDGAVTFPRAVEVGVHGYVQADPGGGELIRAIRTVAKGNAYLCPESADWTFRLLRQRRDSAGSSAALLRLSPQERRVIARMAEGRTNKEIAVKLALSEKTVKNYIANMFVKLEIERRTQAVALYMEAQQRYRSFGKRVPV